MKEKNKLLNNIPLGLNSKANNIEHLKDHCKGKNFKDILKEWLNDYQKCKRYRGEQ